MNEQIDRAKVGQQVRKLREARNLSLRQVAERSGLSINAISRIERGEVSPTISSLERIAEALELRLCDFFSHEPAFRTIHTTPQQRDQPMTLGITLENLGLGATQSKFEAFLVTVDPGCGNQLTPSEHPGHEFVYCLQGTLVYQVGNSRHPLNSGHSLLFEASQPHCFWNPSTEIARFLLVFQSHIHIGLHT